MTDSRRFQRTKEDFTCEKCSFLVVGNGFTNHCPVCLWSKHVDIHPGDREAQCGGLMEPAGVDVRGTEYTIVHQCTKCLHRRKNKSVPDDSFERLVALSTQPH